MHNGTVLLVDDDAGMRALVRRWLQGAGLACLEADSGAAAVELLSREDVDAMVLDVAMPQLDGHGVLAWLRSAPRNRGLPTLVLSAHETGDEHVVRTLEEGATDHLAKPFLGPVLAAKVKRMAQRGQELRALRWALCRSEEDALTDPLTGLFNRRCYDQRLQEEAAWAARHSRTLALATLDLDRFKRINDTYGHPEGDRVLRHTASVLAGSFRREDLRFRMGGEEFAVLMRDTEADEAVAAVERAAQALRNAPLLLGPGLEATTITFSAGVAVTTPQDGHATSDLLARADHALYQAKQDGRDRVCCAPVVYCVAV